MVDLPMEVGLHDFCSDLHALKNLYLLLLNTTDNNPPCAMDEQTRLLLKKLLDNATQEVLQSKIVLPRSIQRDERKEHQMSVELQDCPPATERQNKVSGSIQPEAPPQSEDAPVAKSLISEQSCPICEGDQQQKNSRSIPNQRQENPSRRIPPSDHVARERKPQVLRKGDNRSRVPSRRASPQASRRVLKPTLKRSRVETTSPLNRTPSNRTCGIYLDRVVARKPDHRSTSSIASTGTAKNISRLKDDLPIRLRSVEPTTRPEKPPVPKKLTRAAMVRGDRKTERQISCRVPSRSTRSGSCSSCRSGSGDDPVVQRTERRTLSSRKFVNATTRKAKVAPRGSPRRRSHAVVPSCHVKERRIPRRMLSKHNHITPPTKNREQVGEGRMKRMKNKLAVIFHHHHHHHIHHRGGVGEGSGGESQHASLWAYVRRMLHHGGDGQTTTAAGRQEHHGYLHALLDALLRHVWGTRQRKAAAAKRRRLGKAASRLGKQNKKKKLHWWQLWRRRGGVKLAGGKKGRRLRVGFGRTRSRTTKKS